MASKKELREQNVELRRAVEKAVRELDLFATDLAELVRIQGDAADPAVRILARRVHLVAEELGEELRGALDETTVNLFLRIARHWVTAAIVGGLIEGVAEKYGVSLVTAALDHADVAIGAVEKALDILSATAPIPTTIPTPQPTSPDDDRSEPPTIRIGTAVEVDTAGPIAGVATASASAFDATVEITGSGDPVAAAQTSHGIGNVTPPDGQTIDGSVATVRVDGVPGEMTAGNSAERDEGEASS